jgi:hypothetical protein
MLGMRQHINTSVYFKPSSPTTWHRWIPFILQLEKIKQEPHTLYVWNVTSLVLIFFIMMWSNLFKHPDQNRQKSFFVYLLCPL